MNLFFVYGSVIPNAFRLSAVQTNAQRASRSVWATISSGMPWRPANPIQSDLSSHRRPELERLAYENTCTFLEFCKPLTTLTGPDIALVTVVHFEFLRFGVGHFDRLEVMDMVHLLIEDLSVVIIATEEFRF